jgi:3-methylcrotonyl-CoA carboxylase alpha subunit
MPGVIEKVLVEVGATITANQPLVVMVAMKMEYVIRAARDGRVARVCCAPGDNVKKHAQLVEMDDDSEKVKAAA